MNPHPPIVAAAFADAPTPVPPAGRLVHLALAALANDAGHVETTVHTLEHLTGLLPLVIEAALGANHMNVPLFPAAVTLVDGIVTADLPTGA